MSSILNRTAVGLCLCFGLLAGPAQGLPVTFELNVAFDDGPLAGQSASGSFAVDDADCPARLCTGSFTADNGGLLDFRITVDGVQFTASMDADYPFFPQIDLVENTLTLLSFFADGLPSLSLSASSFGGGPTFAFGSYTSADDLTSFVASDGITAVVMIPEPSMALLIAVGLAGVAGVLRGRRPLADQAHA